jgi:archaellum component FlaC
MAAPTDMIMPMLREIRATIDDGQAETKKDFAVVNKRLDRIEERQKSFSQALAGDSFMSKMLIGDRDERIEALDKKMKKLEAAK